MPKFIGWVPTHLDCLDIFFDLAPVTLSDIVYDLGSGDGRLLFEALEKGAGNCVGIDLDSKLISAAREEAENKKVANRITFIEDDILNVNLSKASVIFYYLFPSASAALRPKFEKELKTGTRIVVEDFEIPGWKPVEVRRKGYSAFYLYHMPPQKTKDYDSILTNVHYDPYEQPYYPTYY
jgi:ubiquinone/menaquinone biosynthesis C-methylase UbiE